MRWNQVTAVFGGALDPPHRGHVEAAMALLRNPGVARVLVMPTGRSPFKAGQTSAEHRLALSRLAFAEAIQSHPEVSVDDLEVKRAQVHPNRPSFTADTLETLSLQGGNFAWVIGVDQLLDLGRWHRFPDLLTLGHWLVLERKETSLPAAHRTLNDWESSGLLTRVTERRWQVRARPERSLELIETPASSISSTMIREYLSIHGVAPEGYLHSSVEAYLKAQGLYGMTPR